MIEIVLCTDDNYVKPTGILMTSLGLMNPGQEFRYHIVSAGLSKDSQKSLNQCAQKSDVYFYTIDESILANCPIRKNEHVSLATYFRLLFPTILPQEISKILYLDGDIICLDSIADLWNTDISDAPAACAPDMRNNDIRIFNRLDLPKDSEYFNAGVMLINLDWWRNNDIQNKTLQYITENKNACLFHDQDALNVFLGTQIKHFSLRYNFQEHFFEPTDKLFIEKKYFDDVENSMKNICLLHFTGRKKPWHVECENPLKSWWCYFQQKTEWAKDPLTHKFTGLKRVKHSIRLLLSNTHIVSRKNIYENLDFSAIENALKEKIQSMNI